MLRHPKKGMPSAANMGNLKANAKEAHVQKEVPPQFPPHPPSFGGRPFRPSHGEGWGLPLIEAGKENACCVTWVMGKEGDEHGAVRRCAQHGLVSEVAEELGIILDDRFSSDEGPVEAECKRTHERTRADLLRHA